MSPHSRSARSLPLAFHVLQVAQSTLIGKKCGNMYCASVYGSLASLLWTVGSDALQGKRIVLFSYGSVWRWPYSLLLWACGPLCPLQYLSLCVILY
jgi:hydroxymethylglutaryl-coenzyme A synthase-like protein